MYAHNRYGVLIYKGWILQVRTVWFGKF
jgi:hypothetical protein